MKPAVTVLSNVPPLSDAEAAEYRAKRETEWMSRLRMLAATDSAFAARLCEAVGELASDDARLARILSNALKLTRGKRRSAKTYRPVLLLLNYAAFIGEQAEDRNQREREAHALSQLVGEYRKATGRLVSQRTMSNLISAAITKVDLAQELPDWARPVIEARRQRGKKRRHAKS